MQSRDITIPRFRFRALSLARCRLSYSCQHRHSHVFIVHMSRAPLLAGYSSQSAASICVILLGIGFVLLSEFAELHRDLSMRSLRNCFGAQAWPVLFIAQAGVAFLLVKIMEEISIWSTNNSEKNKRMRVAIVDIVKLILYKYPEQRYWTSVNLINHLWLISYLDLLLKHYLFNYARKIITTTIIIIIIIIIVQS